MHRCLFGLGERPEALLRRRLHGACRRNVGQASTVVVATVAAAGGEAVGVVVVQ